MKGFVIKGNICYSKSSNEICITSNGYAVCENGLCAGVYNKLPENYKNFPIYDYTDQIIIPGFTDLHVHAPQYAFRGLGMDLELISWLDVHAFTEEAKYNNIEYADKAYSIFTEDLLKSATTRACIFATIHAPATILLMEKREENAAHTLCNTEKWIIDSGKFKNIKPILTPRFIPACSDELMENLSVLQKKYSLPVQSHLSENLGEIEWVKELCPDTKFYGEAYDKYGMFGNNCKTIMAHCIHSGEEEIALMKKQNVFVAHCPESNTNLSSGIAPVRTYLNLGIKTGLGSDIAAGSTLSIFKAMAMAIQCSKLRWRLIDQSLAPLNFEEAFYIASKGGGEFFGNVGSFEKGYEFDAVVIDDLALKHPQELDVKERLERLIYLAEDRNITAKFVNGKKLF